MLRLLPALLLAASQALAQYPARPVRVMVGFAPGGPNERWGKLVRALGVKAE